jgi:hypothetical protein
MDYMFGKSIVARRKELRNTVFTVEAPEDHCRSASGVASASFFWRPLSRIRIDGEESRSVAIILEVRPSFFELVYGVIGIAEFLDSSPKCSRFHLRWHILDSKHKRLSMASHVLDKCTEKARRKSC